jgi:hypothetical protein
VTAVKALTFIFNATIALGFLVAHSAQDAKADSKALSQTSLGKVASACKPVTKTDQSSINAREQARILKPIFASLAKQLSESPLPRLCDQMPDFSCWPDGYFTRGQIDILESGKGKLLIRVPCTMSAYNQTSFFVATFTGSQPAPVPSPTKKKQKPVKIANSVSGPPMLLLFPTHPDFQNVAKFQSIGLKPLEAIVGYRDYEPAKRRITAYTKGLGDGTFGHFHQYEIPTATLIPRLQLSIAKTDLDRKDPYHYERGQLPPFVKSWIRMRALKASDGCLADFQNLQCRVSKK